MVKRVFTRLGCSEPHPAWPRALPGMKGQQNHVSHHSPLTFLHDPDLLLHTGRAVRFLKLQGPAGSGGRRCQECANPATKMSWIRTVTAPHPGTAAPPVPHLLFLSYYALLTNKHTAVFNQCCVLVMLCVISFLPLLPTARQDNSICHKTSNILYIRINTRWCSCFIYPLSLLSEELLHLT